MNDNTIKHVKSVRIAAALALAAAAAIGSAYGGVPLNNLQGTGGIAFNPLAYTAGRPWDGGETNALNGIVSKPQVGGWYVNLTDADINWFALGAAVTLFDRLEISGGYAGINAHKYGAAVFANIDLIPVEQIDDILAELDRALDAI